MLARRFGSGCLQSWQFVILNSKPARLQCREMKQDHCKRFGTARHLTQRVLTLRSQRVDMLEHRRKNEITKDYSS